MRKFAIVTVILYYAATVAAQEQDRHWRIGLFGGAVSYQGDLQPNSFSFSQSNAFVSLWVRKNFSNHLSAKAGMSMGKLSAADRYNRSYLQPRNLSFKTGVKEAFVQLDYSLLDLTTKKLSPYGYFGLSVFHFNPYTYDQQANKVYLNPLSTEGQGLPQYPDRKKYPLTQLALGFGGGLRFAIGDNLMLNLDVGQRKTFTDYLDDVSTTYIDESVLLAARGPKAVELAYRTDEFNGNASSAVDGEQRGTPSEMDWYYYLGLSVEIKMQQLGAGLRQMFSSKKGAYNQRCPKNVL